MANDPISGSGGSITFASGYTQHVREWSVDWSAEELEVTAFADTGRKYIPGFQGATGTYTAYLDSDQAMIAPGAAAAAATLTYATGRFLSGNIIITNISLGVHVDGSRREATFSFRFDDVPSIDS